MYISCNRDKYCLWWLLKFQPFFRHTNSWRMTFLVTNPWISFSHQSCSLKNNYFLYLLLLIVHVHICHLYSTYINSTTCLLITNCDLHRVVVYLKSTYITSAEDGVWWEKQGWWLLHKTIFLQKHLFSCCSQDLNFQAGLKLEKASLWETCVSSPTISYFIWFDALHNVYIKLF